MLFPQVYSFLLVCSFQFCFGCELPSTHFVYCLPGSPRLSIFHRFCMYSICSFIYVPGNWYCAFFSFRVLATVSAWKNSVNATAINFEAYSSFEGVSSDHWIVTAKIRLSLRKNATRTVTTKHYDWALLINRDIRDKYVLELRKRFETLQEKTEKGTQMTNERISSTRTSRRQRSVFQQNLELNIESHGKR